MKKNFLIYSFIFIVSIIFLLHIYYWLFPTWKFLLSGEIISNSGTEITFETDHPPQDSYLIKNKRNITILDSYNNTSLDFTLLQEGDFIDVIYTRRVNRFGPKHKNVISNGDVIPNVIKITKKYD